MSLTVDFSVILQIITFFVVWWFLKRLVFDPFSQVIETRQARTTGTLANANALSADANSAHTRYDAAIAAARSEIAQQSDAARKSAQEETDRVLNAARAEAATTMAQKREAAAREVEAARQSLLSQATSVAEEMLSRASGRSAA